MRRREPRASTTSGEGGRGPQHEHVNCYMSAYHVCAFFLSAILIASATPASATHATHVWFARSRGHIARLLRGETLFPQAWHVDTQGLYVVLG